MASGNACWPLGERKEPIFDGDYSFNTGEKRKLSTHDCIVFAVLVLFSALIGSYHALKNRKAETVLQFLMEYHSMPAIYMGLSAFTSFSTAVTMLGHAGRMYDNASMYFSILFAYLLVAMCTAHIFHPMLYRLDVTTSHQYLELRFGRSVRVISAGIFVMHMLVYSSVILYIPAETFQTVTKFSLWQSICSIGVICVICSSLGGMKGIVWTDIFHASMMFSSLLFVLIRAFKIVGGFETVLESTLRSHTDIFSELNPRSFGSVWSTIITAFLTFMCVLGANQNTVQKTLSCNSVKDAKIAVYIAVLSFTVFMLLSRAAGYYMGAFYENCDPLQIGIVKTSDELLPLFAMDILRFTGLAGLFTMGLFSGSMSTISASITSVTTSILDDLIQSFMIEPISEQQARYMVQCIALVYGFLTLIGAYFMSWMESVLLVSLISTGLTMAPILGVFCLGMFFPWANTKGAVCGILASIAITVTVCITTTLSGWDKTAIRCVSNCHPGVFNVTFTEDELVEPGATRFKLPTVWIPPIAVFSTIVTGLFVSFATGATNPQHIDPLLLISVCDVVFPFSCLPERIRKHLRVIPTETRRIPSFDRPIVRLGTFRSITEFQNSITKLQQGNSSIPSTSRLINLRSGTASDSQRALSRTQSAHQSAIHLGILISAFNGEAHPSSTKNVKSSTTQSTADVKP